MAIRFTDSEGRSFSRTGEFIATANGVEGSLIYAASSLLRDEIAKNGSATFLLDLLPHKSAEQVLVEVRHPRGSSSLSSHLKSRLSLEGIKAAMLHELLDKDAINDPVKLAHAIKGLPVKLWQPGRLTKPSAALVACFLKGRTPICKPMRPQTRQSCHSPCSVPAKCSTGRRPLAATC